MAGLNKVTLIGNLGRDPELRYTANGRPVANFTLATNESWTNREGEREERTEWHRIVAWGKLAEICAEHLSKGKQVYIEGRIQTRDWEDREGNKRRTTEVVADTIQFVGPRPSGGDAGSGDSFQDPSSGDEPQGPVGKGPDDEIPF